MNERVSPGQARARLAAEQARDDPTTYTADVGTHYAEGFDELDKPQGITNLGNGRVRFTAYAYTYLRHVTGHRDGSIDASGQIKLAGDYFPVIRER
ncbi:hypothetical protein [Amycolatopsis sp. cmx-11-51]|uniref:hypothetical protein n=1 Tax=Amycolatopsis sp. cmx-11-51 TaxID=2785797 RepID=UPI0039E50FBC